MDIMAGPIASQLLLTWYMIIFEVGKSLDIYMQQMAYLHAAVWYCAPDDITREPDVVGQQATGNICISHQHPWLDAERQRQR